MDFKYTYSAPTERERREIESIRKQYDLGAPSDKLERLRRLDARVKMLPRVVGIVLGVLGVLVLGLGLAMVMEWQMIAWGAVVGCVGIAVAAAAYPIHNVILSRNKRKYGPLIVELSDRLLNAQDAEKTE